MPSDGSDPAVIARLEQLEAHSADIERHAQQLSDVIAEQWRTIDGLSRGLQRMSDRLAAAEEKLDRVGPPEPPPPHY